MKSIAKPIKKGTVTELTGNAKVSALASVLLTGAIALTASGCTTEVKADGITIESLVVTGYDSTGEVSSTINRTLDNMVGVQSGDSVAESIPAPVGDKNSDEILSADNGDKTESTFPSVNEGTDSEKPAVPTTAPAEDTAATEPVKDVSEKKGFELITDGTVYTLDDRSGGGFKYSEEFGTVELYYENNRLVYRYNGGSELTADIASTRCYCDAYMLKKNGQVFFYVETVRGCDNNELNVYKASENSIQRVGVVNNFAVSGPTFNNTKSFKGYDGGTRYGHLAAERLFKVGSDGMPVPADNYSVMGSAPLKAVNDMTGYIVKDGVATSEKKTIKAGDVLEARALNEVEYVDFKDANGNIVRVDFTEQCCEYYDMKDYRWVYRAILSMATPVYGRESFIYLNDGATVKFTGDNGMLWSSNSYGAYDVAVKNNDTQMIFQEAYLLRKAEKAYIYVEVIGDDDRSYVQVFNIYENACKYVGAVKDLDITSLEDVYSFTCTEVYGAGNGLKITRDYTVNQNGMPVHANNSGLLSSGTTMAATVDLEGRIVKHGKVTSETKKIMAGDNVVPVFVDEADYIEFLDADGDLIKVDFTPYFMTFYDADDFSWLYKAIMSIIRHV